MKLDLHKDLKSLLKQMRERVRDYPKYVNAGPGKDEDDVTQLTAGYQLDQAGWVAFVIDTRPDANMDGSWQSYIAENEIEMAHWCAAYNEMAENEESVNVTLPDGKKKRIDSEEDFLNLIGSCLRSLLETCRDDGLLAKLPVADGCCITVEEHEGQFGWTARLDGEVDDSEEEDDPLEITVELVATVRKWPKAKQIKFWIGRLDELANHDEYECLYVSDLLEELAEIGTDTVVPALKYAVKWADKPELDGDRSPGKKRDTANITELVSAQVAGDILYDHVKEMDHATPQIEKLLREFVAKSVKVNNERTLWGRNPFNAAMCLYCLFKGYPCPIAGDSDNKIDYEPFIGPKTK